MAIHRRLHRSAASGIITQDVAQGDDASNCGSQHRAVIGTCLVPESKLRCGADIDQSM
jgi:hypothetical protein